MDRNKLTIRLDDVQQARLEAFCSRTGMSKQGALVRALEAYIAEVGARTTAAGLMASGADAASSSVARLKARAAR